MRSVFPVVAIVLAGAWLAAAVSLAPVPGDRPARRAPASIATSTTQGLPAARATVAGAEAVRDSVEADEAAAVVGEEACPPASPATAARPGPASVDHAVAELEGALGGPDFAPTMESVRRSLVPLLASDPCAVEEAVERVLDLRSAGEVRAVLLEALVAGPGVGRARGALLIDPSPIVRESAWRLLANARK